MPLRGADDGGRAQHPQHPARPRDHRLLPRPRRGEGAHHRPRVREDHRAGAGTRQGEAPRDRLRRSRICGPWRPLGRARIRGVPRGGRSRFRLAAAWRRMGRDCAKLHLGHHGRSQGRGVPPSRRLPPRHGQHRDLLHGQASGVSVDAAHVPLQRLVLSLVDLGGGRHPCVPAPGAWAGHVRCDRGSRRHASVRRADRDVDAAQRARGTKSARCPTLCSSSPPPRRPRKRCWPP